MVKHKHISWIICSFLHRQSTWYRETEPAQYSRASPGTLSVETEAGVYSKDVPSSSDK